jgi:hypothetical protein
VGGASVLSVEAVAWSLFGLLAATLGVLVTAYWRLAARIDELRRDLGARIDAQTARIDAHIHPHAG